MRCICGRRQVVQAQNFGRQQRQNMFKVFCKLFPLIQLAATFETFAKVFYAENLAKKILQQLFSAGSAVTFQAERHTHHNATVVPVNNLPRRQESFSEGDTPCTRRNLLDELVIYTIKLARLFEPDYRASLNVQAFTKPA